MPDELTALALAAGGGDRAALTEFVRASQAEVWRFTARAAGREAADDLTQETYLRVLTALPSYQGRAKARSWLLAIAHHVVVDRVRREVARPRLVGVEATELEALSAGHPGFGDGLEVEQALARLTPERRTALVLTRLMGFSYAEAAEICGCPVGTVRSRVARARADLLAEYRVTPAAGWSGRR